MTHLGRVRASLASSRILRTTFDYTYARLYRSFYSSAMIRHRVAPYLDAYPDVEFSRTGTGFSQFSEVNRLARLGVVHGKDVLLVGAGEGPEVEALWGRHRPRSLVGIDIGDYEAEWVKCNQSNSMNDLPLRFVKMDGSMLGLRPRSFDLVYSQGVMPHVKDVKRFLDEAERVLRPGGIFYAFCCPLWRT